MTPEEAIKTLELNNKGREALGVEALCTPLLEAQRLGIEALKRLVWDRRYGTLSSSKLLPGETEE